MPVNMAKAKLANNSPMISASPTSTNRMPLGKSRMLGNWLTRFLASPKPTPDNSITNTMLRVRL